MDAPLLALTRGRPPPPPGAPPNATATDNMRQLIQLRWFAVAGQLATILVVRFALGVALPTAPLLGVVALLAFANLTGAVLLRRHRVTDTEFLLALLFDVGTLTVQLFLTGGADNPFAALFLTQVVLGAILLRNRSAWALVAVTGCCYALLTQHFHPLRFPPGLLGEVADLLTLGRWLSFALVAVLLVMFNARISRNLRARDAFLADMRQRAAEEDSVVRMGLFASGAAHELGTPLASLSVILSDWARVPKLASDPELATELREMQAEVGRCKSIVTDILHSAGEPRSEAMGRVEASHFLEDMAATWSAVHPAATLRCHWNEMDGAAVVADRSLRQAMWNLLENAAESSGQASPGPITLTAGRQDGMLLLSVRDRGPGFSPEALRAFGQPYRSAKGEGHGVGLFLVATVARRLGGQVTARNLTEGGAEVCLLVPLVSPPGAADPAGRDA